MPRAYHPRRLKINGVLVDRHCSRCGDALVTVENGMCTHCKSRANLEHEAWFANLIEGKRKDIDFTRAPIGRYLGCRNFSKEEL